MQSCFPRITSSVIYWTFLKQLASDPTDGFLKQISLALELEIMCTAQWQNRDISTKSLSFFLNA
jgi:hypothetical protein